MMKTTWAAAGLFFLTSLWFCHVKSDGKIGFNAACDFDDKELEDAQTYTFKTPTARTAVECATHCANWPVCSSFFFSRHDGLCQLHKLAFPSPSGSTPTPTLSHWNGTRYFRLKKPECEDAFVQARGVPMCVTVLLPDAGYKNFADAAGDCTNTPTQTTADTAQMDSPLKRQWIRELLKTAYGAADSDTFYVGARRIYGKTTFAWLTGAAIPDGEFSVDSSAYRKNTASTFDCVVMSAEFESKFDVVPCDDSGPFQTKPHKGTICEIPTLTY